MIIAHQNHSIIRQKRSQQQREGKAERSRTAVSGRRRPTNLFLALPDDLGRRDASGDAAGDGQGGPLLQRAQHPVRGALPAHPQHGLPGELYHVQTQVGPPGGRCSEGAKEDQNMSHQKKKKGKRKKSNLSQGSFTWKKLNYFSILYSMKEKKHKSFPYYHSVTFII